MKRLFLICTLAFAPVPALAHKVIAGVFPAGDSIEGEIGFSSGDMATSQEVIILGPNGEEIGRSMTDDDGFFVFTPQSPVAHTFVADLGAGHVAEVTMTADEVAKIMGLSSVPQAVEDVAISDMNSSVVSDGLTDRDRLAIAAFVRDEIRPLRREIAAYREHNDLQSIMGGIGYIIGLFGIGFYVAARRKVAT